MATYDYLILGLDRGLPARTRFREAIARAGLGQRTIGLFTAQLGWEASQIALLAERAQGESEIPQALEALSLEAEVGSCEFHTLRLLARPTSAANLAPGGIYVHRWFEVEAASLDAFVGLSSEAWPDFEARFDARIFGLFEDETPAPGLVVGRLRLLLITRYADHGVWEASRDPTTEAMQTFARRAALTLSTRGASTLLTPL